MGIPKIDRRVFKQLLWLLIAWGAASLAFRGWPVHILFGLLTLFHFFFFRDPEAVLPSEDGPVSPAQGKVAEVSSFFEESYLKCEAVRIGIFLSIFDVHVTRSPLAGRVDYLRYVPGKFLNALKEESVKYNESNWIGIQNGSRRVLVRQIAGVIARRICCDVREGSQVSRGGKLGIICYGSRVELIIPKASWEPLVTVGQKVFSGRTLIGRWKDGI